MFKDLINVGSNLSATFMASFQSTVGGLFGKGIGGVAGRLTNATSRVIDIVDAFKPDVAVRDAKVQSSTYGRLIPEIFGKTRIEGNIIWSSPIVKTKSNYSSLPIIDKLVGLFGINTGGSSIIIRSSFAIALGKGPIDDVLNIYADEQMLNLATLEYTVYRGTEDQEPSSVIQSYIGVDNTPAFRDLAYIVFDNFPLENYNGRMPNFTFDVARHSVLRRPKSVSPEELITGITMIPGSGEFVYDTIKQYKYRLGSGTGSGLAGLYRVSKNRVMNANTNIDKTDFMVSLDNLKKDLPNIKWVSLIVSWFCNSTNIKDANIYPAYEFRNNSTEPSKWKVAGINRISARLITLDEKGKPIYGGTVSDDAVIRAVVELRKRGYKICFYPMLFVDKINKPWRGHITGDIKYISSFFNKRSGYNQFIKHYAGLLKNKIDAFVIGSEFIGLTKLQASNNSFPAVDELTNLASFVRNIMGDNVKLTYAADWSEYHHTKEGWFNMDKLWASNDIDMIGIDAYFPLTNSPLSTYDISKLMKGWESEEGYDFYYTDKNKTKKENLEPRYAWKNIQHFWSNTHSNPDGQQTQWRPKMKKVWFTEYGFPSVDCTSNQPNVFYTPESTEGGFPHLSQGRVDFKAQRCAIYATEKYWLNSEMVEQKFVWTWDARPYPFFPSLLNIWSDGAAWKYGHFLNGKIGYSTLADIVAYLCNRAGLRDDQVNVDALDIDVSGYVIDTKSSAMNHINLLADIFGFDGYMKGSQVVFQMMRDFVLHRIPIEEVLIENGEAEFVQVTNLDHNDFPTAIEILFQNIDDGYRIGVARVSDVDADGKNVEAYNLGIAADVDTARKIAGNILLSRKLKQHSYALALPNTYKNIEPMDIIELVDGDKIYSMRILSTIIRDSASIMVNAISDDKDVYSLPSYEIEYAKPEVTNMVGNVVDTLIEIVEPYRTQLTDEISNPYVYCAIYSMEENWQGAIIYTSQDGGETYQEITSVTQEGVVGSCIQALSTNIKPFVVDNTSTMEIVLYGGNIENIHPASEEMMLSNHNLAIVGNEIVSLRDINIIGSNRAIIKGFLRGRFSTEKYISSHKVGDRFILLTDPNILKLHFSPQSIGKEIIVIVQSRGQSFENATKARFTLRNHSEIDLYPVGIEVNKQQEDFRVSWFSRPKSEFIFFDDVDRVDDTKYNVVIHDASGTPIRKIFVEKQNTVSYTKQMQTEDFGKSIDGLVINDS